MSFQRQGKSLQHKMQISGDMSWGADTNCDTNYAPVCVLKYRFSDILGEISQEFHHGRDQRSLTSPGTRRFQTGNLEKSRLKLLNR
jgi:hypothetical protein